MNGLKIVLLMTALSALLVVAGRALGGQNGMVIAFGLACIMNLGTYWFSDRIVLRMYKAREVTSDEVPVLFTMVRDLSARANLPMPKVYIIPGEAPNAFATGRNPSHAAVAVTEGIMRLLSKEELMGVLGHELAHIRNRDILIGTIAATFAGAIAMLANMAQWAMIFGGRNDEEGQNPIAVIAMMIIAPMAAMVIQMAISRSREYLADRDGAKIHGNPRHLARALAKLQRGAERAPMDASPATAHMFIVNPLRGSGVMKFFSTHPPVTERIRRLEQM
ncbi:MAG: zinc metalloprotease HtpX [Desulfobacteraceae bacterium]|jgi:heat shock protein HtpX|nr:zinc metalloprotease HtpX [Desulfobacteraceae bacterium]